MMNVNVGAMAPVRQLYLRYAAVLPVELLYQRGRGTGIVMRMNATTSTFLNVALATLILIGAAGVALAIRVW